MQKAVKDLKPGDLIDMEPHNPKDALAEFEYGRVDSLEVETPDCTVVHFANLNSFAFSPEQLVNTSDEGDQF